MGTIKYPRCQYYNGNGNNNNNNNNNNGQNMCDGIEEGPQEGEPMLAQALSYLLYNPTDVDMYSLVISCGSENDMYDSQENNNQNGNNNNNNNNNNQQSEECEYE